MRLKDLKVNYGIKFLVCHLSLMILFVPVRLFAAPPLAAGESRQVIASEDKTPLHTAAPTAQTEEERELAFLNGDVEVEESNGSNGAGALGVVGQVVGGLGLGVALLLAADQVGAPNMVALGVGAGGVSIGVWGVGEWVGWDGSYLATLVGVAAMGALTILSMEGSGQMGALVFGALVPLGGVAGYHLSDSWRSGASAYSAPSPKTVSILQFDF